MQGAFRHTAVIQVGYIGPSAVQSGPRAQRFPLVTSLNLLKPNDIYICRTATLTSRRYILNNYSTNIHTEYIKHAA